MIMKSIVFVIWSIFPSSCIHFCTNVQVSCCTLDKSVGDKETIQFTKIQNFCTTGMEAAKEYLPLVLSSAAFGPISAFLVTCNH